MDKFTGMTDGRRAYTTGFTTDTSSRGRRFWVGWSPLSLVQMDKQWYFI
jgi:hypothetical protein